VPLHWGLGQLGTRDFRQPKEEMFHVFRSDYNSVRLLYDMCARGHLASATAQSYIQLVRGHGRHFG